MAAAVLVGALIGGAAMLRQSVSSAPEPWTFRPLTYSGQAFVPALSPDGKQVAYVSTREQYAGIYRKAWDGTGEEEMVFRYTPGAGMVLTD